MYRNSLIPIGRRVVYKLIPGMSKNFTYFKTKLTLPRNPLLDCPHITNRCSFTYALCNPIVIPLSHAHVLWFKQNASSGPKVTGNTLFSRSSHSASWHVWILNDNGLINVVSNPALKDQLCREIVLRTGLITLLWFILSS